ncbi:MAG TPA: hypothetical protein VFJ85_09845 [Acidimicrobiales bacterium]|nr:hypothetical protein [Acidimicrobiales bacterium]
MEGVNAAEKEAAKKAAEATTLAAVGTGLWWAGKALSAGCGPAAPLCALAL